MGNDEFGRLKSVGKSRACAAVGQPQCKEGDAHKTDCDDEDAQQEKHGGLPHAPQLEFLGEVTGHKVARRDFVPCRCDLAADILGIAATGMEVAA